MELRDIEYFAVVAEQRHLGRAAELLKLTQPALSKSLRRLETALGVKLVRRTPRGVDLTAEGSALAARARGLRLSLEDVAREVRDVTAGRVANLSVGAAPGVPERLLPIPCTTLLKDAPKVHVRVTIAHNNLLLPALRSGDLELIVSGIPEKHYEDLVQEHLYDDEFAVFAASHHPLAKHRNPGLADLVPFRWAAATADVLAWRWLSRAFENHGLPAPRSAFEAGSYPLRALITASSDLLCFNSRLGFLESARNQSLGEIPVTELKWTRRVGVSHRKGAYLSPAAQRFIQLLRSTAKQARPG